MSKKKAGDGNEGQETVAITYRSIPLIPDDLVLEMEPEVFGKLLSYHLDKFPKETAGFFDVNESHEDGPIIDWIYHDTNAIETNVTVNYGDSLALNEYNKLWEGYPNGQWHTHPGLGVFWSSTDEDSQILTVLELIRSGEEQGAFYFIVIDRLATKLTKIVWLDGKIHSRQNGYITVLGTPIKSQPVKNYTSSYTPTNKGGFTNRQYNRPSNNYGVNGSTNKTPKRQGDDPKILETDWSWWAKYTGKDSSDGDDIDTDVSTNDEKFTTHVYMGTISDRSQDYDELFELFEIQKYNWPDLHDEMEIYFPGQYSAIVNGDIPWKSLKPRKKFIDEQANWVFEEEDEDPDYPLHHPYYGMGL